MDAADRAILRVAGALSLAAAALHGVATEEHFAEWWGYGLFFVLAAFAQGVFAIVLFALALGRGPAPPHVERTLRATAWAGVVGNLAVIALYAVTRTVGIPVFGPEAGRVEPVGPVDVASKVAEGLLVCLLVAVLWRGAGRRRVGQAPPI